MNPVNSRADKNISTTRETFFTLTLCQLIIIARAANGWEDLCACHLVRLLMNLT